MKTANYKDYWKSILTMALENQKDTTTTANSMGLLKPSSEMDSLNPKGSIRMVKNAGRAPDITQMAVLNL